MVSWARCPCTEMPRSWETASPEGPTRVLGGGVFLMGEVPLYGYLAHRKQPPPRTLLRSWEGGCFF